MIDHRDVSNSLGADCYIQDDEPGDVSAKRLRRSQSPTQASASLEAIHSQIDPDPSLVKVTITKAELNELSNKVSSPIFLF